MRLQQKQEKISTFELFFLPFLFLFLFFTNLFPLSQPLLLPQRTVPSSSPSSSTLQSRVFISSLYESVPTSHFELTFGSPIE